MKNTVTVTFKIDGVEIKTNARVPQLKNGINAEHYDDIKAAVVIDKSNLGRD
ncbi:hypothetical protein [Bacillus pumilus]|uniref:hypothetical protein n=1 Tax=Bacillus pumilus TaxID=1408 RepID=UPI0016432F46|nr:hypothetical protein [Bacillus pumilus]